MADPLRERLQASLGNTCTIDRELGGGGMSHVFVATETSLGRQIVVKVLPPDTASSVSAERFKREIQVAARLQHPHIVPLLSAGDAAGLPYFTMPFVKGESLRHRLAKGGELSINETVHVLRDVAAALAHAHGEGVVHRDIKPENVMLSGGVAVVTDFGVAKAVDVALSDGGSDGSALTSLGVALGTPAYMAPEQATADPKVDHRADIYSFGVVAYEMLAGSSPFAGRPPQQLLAAQVNEVPENVGRRRPNTPPALATLVMKCLEKRAGDRPQSADELLAALDAIATPSGGMTPTQERIVATAPRQRTMARALGTAVIVMAIVAALLWSRRAPPALHAGTSTMIAATPDAEIDPGISPDGKLVAYAAETGKGMKIFVRQVSGGRANLLTAEVPGAHESPRWSPDGSQIAFSSDTGDVYVIPALGGTARRVARGRFPSWSPSGTELAWGGPGGIWVQPVAGGATRQVAKGLTTLASWPSWSPDGRYIAFANGNQPTRGNLSTNVIRVVSAAGGDPVRVSDSTHVNLSPAWTPDGRSLLYVSNLGGARDVYQQAMNGGRPAGAPQRLTTGLGPYCISLSADGTRLAYDAVRTSSNVWSAPIPASGTVDLKGAKQLTRENQRVEVMNLSHDGKWLAYDSDRSGNFDIYKIAAEGGEPVQLTSDPGNDFNPTWSPDDKQIAFHSQRTGVRHIYVTSADGNGDELIATGPGQDFMPNWALVGNKVAFRSITSGSGQVYVTTREANGKWSPPKAVNQDNSLNSTGPRWSPDGTLIAYATNLGLVLAPADGGPSRLLVDARTLGGDVGGLHWTPSPSMIYASVTLANGRGRLIAVSPTGGPVRTLLEADVRLFGRPDIATDGKRLFFTLGTWESDVGVLELRK